MNQVNGLSNAEAERLMILANQMGKLQTTISAIMLHGLESVSPHEHISHKRLLSTQFADLSAGISVLIGCGDISKTEFESLIDTRAVEIVGKLRFNGETNLDLATTANEEASKSWTSNVYDFFRNRKKKT